MKFHVGVIGATGYIGTPYREEMRGAPDAARIVALCARRHDRLQAAPPGASPGLGRGRVSDRPRPAGGGDAAGTLEPDGGDDLAIGTDRPLATLAAHAGGTARVPVADRLRSCPVTHPVTLPGPCGASGAGYSERRAAEAP